MRIMYDAINPNLIPGNPQMVAGYVNGKWPSFFGYQQYNPITNNYDQIPSIVKKFPSAVHVSIAVSSDANALVLDCEQYDATPADCPGWAIRQRARGIEPTIYVSMSQWSDVIQQFSFQNVKPPQYWIADYDGVATIPLGAVAKQYMNTSGYDLSVVQSYWPSVDPNPLLKPIRKDSTAMIYVNNDDPNKAAFVIHPDGSAFWIENGNDEVSMVTGGFPRAYVSAKFFQAISNKYNPIKY